MLPGDHYRTAELVSQLMTNAQMKSVFDLIECLKPDLTVTDKYRYSYYNIIGEGETLHKAMMDFDRKFYNQKAGDESC